MSIVAISGGFDPIHVGHIRLIKAASKLGELIVIINSDEWLMRKKGYVFMPWHRRTEIIEAIAGVRGVMSVDDSDDTVCEALSGLKPDYFANGGDRKEGNTPEVDLCKCLGIIPLFNVGGDKADSSSILVKEAAHA